VRINVRIARYIRRREGGRRRHPKE
jgi:hypothetical protein